MAAREDLLKAAGEKRETAARLRRWAQALSLHDDRLRLMQQAAEIEKEAEALEQATEGDQTSAPPAAHGMPMQQQQVQQQQQHETPPTDSKDSGHKP